MVDTVPSESDINFKFDLFTERVEEYIKPDKIKQFKEQLSYLQRDITEEFSGIYSIMETIDSFVWELGV